MKTPLQIIIALCVLPLCLNAQRWFPENATWTFNRQRLLSFRAHGYTKYTVVKDTVINNTAAKLIVVNAVEYDGVESARDSLFVYELDSRVYLWNGSEFKLMYDFNLNAGDTLNVSNDIIYPDCSRSPITVDSISNIILNGQNLKVQHISYTIFDSTLVLGEYIMRTRIMERVGIEKQFIFSPTCLPHDQSGHPILICLPYDEFAYSGLRCYNDDSISYKDKWWSIQFPGVDCDSLINGKTTNIQKVEEGEFLIFPNPSDDFVTISNPSRSTDGYYVELYNSLGEKLNRMEYENTARIDLRPYQAGMYLLKIYREASPVRTFKIIKN